MAQVLKIMLPLYLLISLGMLFNARSFPSQRFWPEVERLVYYILFPALIFSNLSHAQLSTELMQSILLVVTLPTMLMGLLQGLGLIGNLVSRATMTSMFQGSVRNNTTLTMVIAALIMPDNGVALVALTMTSMIMINNLVSVWVLAHYGEHASQTNFRKISKDIFSNPLILASAAGLALNISPLSLPDTLLSTIKYLGNTGLPLALLAIGAGLRFKALSGKAFAICWPTLCKMMILPGIIWLLCHQLDIDTELSRVFILYGAMPTAISSYVLASQMGGDKQTMAQIISFQMIVAAVSLPVVLGIIQTL